MTLLSESRYNWQNVQILVFSTLRDMYAEREYLLQCVFPSLDDWCRQWRLQLTDIYYSPEIQPRTDEPTIAIFLIGQRCDWLLADSSPDGEVQLASKVKSFLYLLPQNHCETFFFLRETTPSDPGKFLCWSAKEREEYRRAFLPEKRQRKIIEAIRRSIRQYYEEKGSPPQHFFSYYPDWDESLSNPEDKKLRGRFSPASLRSFGENVKEVVKKTISGLFEERLSELSRQNPWLRQRNYHEASLYFHTRFFWGRIPDLQVLLRYVRSNDSRGILSVCGDPGIGKSALLASFCNYLDIRLNYALIYHSIIANLPESAELPKILQRLCWELQQHYLLEEEIPDDFDQLITLFHKLLHASTRLTILIIDGLDYLDSSVVQRWDWFLEELPPHVKIIVSLRDGATRRQIEQYVSCIVSLPPLPFRDICDIVAAGLSSSKHNLNPVQRFLVEKNPLLSIPRHLWDMLQAIRCLSSSASISEGIVCWPETSERFYVQMIGRLEQEYRKVHPELVTTMLGLIYTSRDGLHPLELGELLASLDDNDTYRDILQRLRVHLDWHGDRVAICHPVFRHVIEQMLYKGTNALYWHDFLCDYFTPHPLYLSPRKLNIRKLHEQIWHQQHSRNWSALIHTLCDIHFLQASADSGRLPKLRADYSQAIAALPPGYRQQLVPGVDISSHVLRWIARIFEIETPSLRQEPRVLFQTLWNYGYWHDCPEARWHYVLDSDDEVPPWKRQGDKVFSLVEHWRRQQTRVWLRAIRPLRWRIKSSLLRIFRSEAEISCVRFIDKDNLLWGTQNGAVEGWQIKAGTRKRKLLIQNKIEAICPRGVYVATLPEQHTPSGFKGENSEITIWNLRRKTRADIPIGRHWGAATICLSPDGAKVAVMSEDAVSISDFERARLHFCRSRKSPGNIFCFHPHGHMFVTTNFNSVLLWKVGTGQQVTAFRTYKKRCIDGKLGFSADGERVYCLPWDCSILSVFDLSGKLLEQFPLQEESKNSRAVDMWFDGGLFALLRDDGALEVWNIAMQKLVKRSFLPAQKISLSRDGSRIAICSKREIFVHKVSEKMLGSTLSPLASSVEQILFSRDGSKIAFVAQKSIEIWHRSGTKLSTMPMTCADDYRGAAVCFSPTADHLYLSIEEPRPHLAIYDIHQWQRQIIAREDAFIGINYNGTRAAFLSTGGQIHIRGLPYNDDICTLENVRYRDFGLPMEVAFSHDDSKLAMVISGTLYIWELSKGKILYSLAQSFGEKLLFSPDDSKIATTKYDDEGNTIIQIWDMQSGFQRRITYRDSIPVFSEDSNSIVAYSPTAKRKRIFDIASNRCIGEMYQEIPVQYSSGPAAERYQIAVFGIHSDILNERQFPVLWLPGHCLRAAIHDNEIFAVSEIGDLYVLQICKGEGN